MGSQHFTYRCKNIISFAFREENEGEAKGGDRTVRVN